MDLRGRADYAHKKERNVLRSSAPEAGEDDIAGKEITGRKPEDRYAYR
jgi:hypothetical protein